MKSLPSVMMHSVQLCYRSTTWKTGAVYYAEKVGMTTYYTPMSSVPLQQLPIYQHQHSNLWGLPEYLVHQQCESNSCTACKNSSFFSADAQHGTYCWDLSVQLSICWLVTVMYCTETVKSNLTKSIFAFLWLSKAVTYLPVVTFCSLRQVSARAHALAKLCACARPGSVPYKSSGCPRLWHLFSQSVRHFHSVSQHLLTST